MGDKIRIRCNKCNKVLLDIIDTSVVEIKCQHCKKKYQITVKDTKVISQEIK